MENPLSQPPIEELALLKSPRPNEETVMRHFRRLRGPADALRSGSRQALRDYLVLLHSSLVDHCARTFLSSGEPTEDLLQEGSIGLIKAVDRFDPEKGVRFSTYACHLISGEIRHYLRDLGKIIHEPGWHAELRLQVNRASDDLTQKLERPPQPEEIASALDMQGAVVRRVLDSGNVLSVASLDAENDEENNGTKLYSYDETDTALESLSTSVENRITLNAALPQLRDLEQRAVTMFYYGEQSKTEIARQMGISVNYAAYLVKRGVEHLRRIIESEAPVQTAPPDLPLPLAWTDLSRWIEDSTQRDGAPREFALLLCRLWNWEAASARLSAEARYDAAQNASAVMRRSCRKADKVVAVNGAPFGGLCFLALMPNTGAVGQRAGDRWRRACDAISIYPENPAALADLQIEYSFAYSEGDNLAADGTAETQDVAGSDSDAKSDSDSKFDSGADSENVQRQLDALLHEVLLRRPETALAPLAITPTPNADDNGLRRRASDRASDNKSSDDVSSNENAKVADANVGNTKVGDSNSDCVAMVADGVVQQARIL